jgi:hypothetical protein
LAAWRKSFIPQKVSDVAIIFVKTINGEIKIREDFSRVITPKPLFGSTVMGDLQADMPRERL